MRKIIFFLPLIFCALLWVALNKLGWFVWWLEDLADNAGDYVAAKYHNREL